MSETQWTQVVEVSVFGVKVQFSLTWPIWKSDVKCSVVSTAALFAGNNGVVLHKVKLKALLQTEEVVTVQRSDGAHPGANVILYFSGELMH